MRTIWESIWLAGQRIPFLSLFKTGFLWSEIDKCQKRAEIALAPISRQHFFSNYCKWQRHLAVTVIDCVCDSTVPNGRQHLYLLTGWKTAENCWKRLKTAHKSVEPQAAHPFPSLDPTVLHRATSCWPCWQISLASKWIASACGRGRSMSSHESRQRAVFHCWRQLGGTTLVPSRGACTAHTVCCSSKWPLGEYEYSYQFQS